MKKQKQQKQNKPKSGLASFCVSVTALILVFAVCFIFLIFSTDVVINVDIQTRANTEVVRPTQVSITIQKVEDLTGSNGSGDGTPNPPPDNTGVTPPPGTTPVIDKELKEWVDNCPITFPQKQKTLALVYYVMNKNGYSNPQISAVLGNICCEGDVGRFEGIPYGKTGGYNNYYENSWRVASIYNNFTDFTVSRYGNKSHEYAEIYSYKIAQDQGMTWEQLKTMFSATAPLAVNVYGFGCIQFTSGTYHKNFLDFININALTGATDFYTVAEMETSNLCKRCCDVFNQNTPSGYSGLHSNCQFTVAQLQNSMGYTSGEKAELVEATAVFFTKVEIGKGYKTLAENKRRAEVAVSCYDAIKAAGY